MVMGDALRFLVRADAMWAWSLLVKRESKTWSTSRVPFVPPARTSLRVTSARLTLLRTPIVYAVSC